MARKSRLAVHGDASYPDVTDKGVEAISATFAARFMASLIARMLLSPTHLAARKPAPESRAGYWVCLSLSRPSASPWHLHRFSIASPHETLLLFMHVGLCLCLCLFAGYVRRRGQAVGGCRENLRHADAGHPESDLRCPRGKSLRYQPRPT